MNTWTDINKTSALAKWPHLKKNKTLAMALETAIEVGSVLSRGYFAPYETYTKEDKSIYTPFDEEVELLIKEKILQHEPGSKIMGEELSPNEDVSKGSFWVIDGIDGTSNFARSIPVCNVTFAKIENKQVVLGIVFDFLHQELFYALKGKGAYLNGKRITVKDRPFDESMITFAPLLHCRKDKGEQEEKEVNAVWKSMQEIAIQSNKFHREFFAGALELGWVASGRLDGYVSSWTNPWDLSAGVLLVKEAGGIVTNIEGKEWQPSYWGVIAGTRQIHPNILKILQNNYRAEL